MPFSFGFFIFCPQTHKEPVSDENVLLLSLQAPPVQSTGGWQGSGRPTTISPGWAEPCPAAPGPSTSPERLPANLGTRPAWPASIPGHSTGTSTSGAATGFSTHEAAAGAGGETGGVAGGAAGS